MRNKSITLLKICAPIILSIVSQINIHAQNEVDIVSGDTVITNIPLNKLDLSASNRSSAALESTAIQVDFLKASTRDEIMQTNQSPASVYSMSTELLDEDYAVGQIPYDESVTPTGGRMYSIPIMVSKSDRYAPQLSLQYNSQSGNGIAGYGWHIGGLSSITITNKTIYYNGVPAPADVDDGASVFSLDGIPLVQNDDASLVSEYPLETARGHIIVKKHMTGNIISHFTALFPDGSTARYGYTTNTIKQSQYPLTYKEDRLGNVVYYNYENFNSVYRLNSVQFGHKNSNSDLSIIYFTYESRSDCFNKYYAGLLTKQSYILKSITSYVHGNTIRAYHLNHELRDNVNLLISVDCSIPNGEQLRPLRFTYGQSDQEDYQIQDDMVRKDYMFMSSYFTPSSDVQVVYKRGKFVSGDYSDGVVFYPVFHIYDIVAAKATGIFGQKKHYKFGSTYSPDQVLLVAPKPSYISDVDNTILAESEFQVMQPVDVDGDGKDEIVKVNFNGTSTSSSTTTLKISIYSYDSSTGAITKDRTFNVSVNGIVISGDYVSPICRSYRFGDFDGDGKVELATISYNETALGDANTSYLSLIDLESGTEISETNVFSMAVDDEIICVDLDGDGRTEMCRANNSGIDIYNLSASTFTLTRHLSSPTLSLLSYGYHCTDVNGDGYIDIAIEPTESSSTWRLFKYDGNSFLYSSFSLYNRTESDTFFFYDVNKDGLSDIVQQTGTAMHIFPNVNSTFPISERIVSNLVFPETADIVSCEFNGYNTMSDFITVDGAYVNLYGFSKDLSAERLLTRFENSLGATTVNNYENLSSTAYAYHSESTRLYSTSSGYVKARFPLQLLYNTQTYLTPDMLYSDKVNDLWYSYFDACVNKHGLGFSGFGKVRTTDFMGVADKELVVIETKEPQKMGVTTKVEHAFRMSQTDPFKIHNYTYDSHSTQYGKLNPRLTRISQADSLSGLESLTTYTYDSYDYPLSVSTSYTGGEGLRLTEINESTYIHSASLENYCLGTVNSVVRKNVIPSEQLEFIPTRPTALTGAPLADTLIRFPILNPDEQIIPSTYWIERKTYQYDDRMLPTSCVLHVGDTMNSLAKKAETRWTYDAYGNVLSETSAPYNVSVFTGDTYTYDSSGKNVTSVTDKYGHETTYGNYDKYGNVQSSTDYAGRTTSYSYDEWGNLKTIIMPDGTRESDSLSWGGTGRLVAFKYVTGQPAKSIHYDALGRELRTGTQRFDGHWIFVDKVYGSNGMIQKESLPFKDTSTATLWNIYEYDDYLRPLVYTHASGNMTTWSYNGNSTTESKNGIWSTRIVDSKGQVVKVQDAGGSIEYTLRADGQPSEVAVSGGLTTTFEYDAYGRRKKIVDPSAGTQTDNIVYNSDGSAVATHTNPNGSIITYADMYGRVTKIERPGEYTTDYAYDSDGLLISETSSNGTSTAYTYDGYDRVLTVVETVPDGKWLRKTFSYTTGSNVSAIAYESQNGAITTENFVYSNGTNIGIGIQGTYVRLINGENEFGQPTSVSTGGITRTYSYNSYGQPTRRTMGSVMDYSYSFDPLKGNLMSRTDNLRNQTETFGYDALNRLTVIDDREIAYSDNGNITSIDSVGDMTYDNSAKPYQVTSLTLEDDVVPSRVQNVTYTCYSRPSIMTEGGRSAAFTYNGDGARVKMNVSDGATSVLSRYYIGNQYELDVTPTGTTERLYLGGDAYSAPVVYIKEGSGAWTFYNIGRDYLGNITHIATADGTLVEENSYDPWGRLRNPETREIYSLGTEPELMLGRGYTGHEHLTWFGLINMNARLYDPVLGCFLSPDPFVQMPDFTQNFNRYSYCLNNPLVYVDENGEYVWAIFGAIGGILNLISNWDNIDGFLDGLSTFAVGFGAGALAVVSGGSSIWAAIGVGAATSAVTSFNNEMVAQTGANFTSDGNINWDNVWMSTVSGAVAGAASGAVGSWASSANITVNGMSSPLLNSAVTSTMSAGAGHIAGGTSYNLMSGQGLSEAFQNSLYGVGKSMLLGGVIGMGTTTATCLATGINPLTGVSITSKDLNLDLSVQRIQNKESYPHKNDGAVFKNNEGYLPPSKDPNYYREYVHPTPGVKGPGPQRIITGSRGEWYYTPDHYKIFIRFVP